MPEGQNAEFLCSDIVMLLLDICFFGYRKSCGCGKSCGLYNLRAEAMVILFEPRI